MGALGNPFKVGDVVVHISSPERKLRVYTVKGNMVTAVISGKKLGQCHPLNRCLGELYTDDYMKFSFAPGADKIKEVIEEGSKVQEEIKEKQDAKTGTDKRRFSLFPIEALQAALDVIESGNIDLPWRDAYPIDSWKRKSGDYKRRYLDALSRHLFDYIKGENFTEDTGLFTMAAVMVNAAFLLQFEIEELGIYPSNDGKEEIKRMKEGKKAYEQ